MFFEEENAFSKFVRPSECIQYECKYNIYFRTNSTGYLYEEDYTSQIRKQQPGIPILTALFVALCFLFCDIVNLDDGGYCDLLQYQLFVPPTLLLFCAQRYFRSANITCTKLAPNHKSVLVYTKIKSFFSSAPLMFLQPHSNIHTRNKTNSGIENILLSMFHRATSFLKAADIFSI